jgi:[protein-PII] uridylyltransferase
MGRCIVPQNCYTEGFFMQVVETSTAPRGPFRIDSPTLGKEIKVYMERHRAAVAELIKKGDEQAGLEASGKWSRAFDGLLCALFCALRGSVGDEKTWKSLSLAAVGSYGRVHLGYRSDLDVRLLCDNPSKAEEIAEAILYPLWDAGLQIGHQVVTISDTIALAKKDLPTATTLLDFRLVAGDAVQANKLQEKAFSSVFAPRYLGDFLNQMREQAMQRWDRFGDSVYLLEPDVKNGQGGLRDLDIVSWAARARWRVDSLRDLVALGVLVAEELRHIEQASSFLARVRNILHFHSPRRTERLSFEAQEMVSLKMGYGKGGAACESMMSDYYRHARVISNARESLLIRAEPPPKRRPKPVDIGSGILEVGETIAVAEPQSIKSEPVLALRAYWEAVHRDLPIDRMTREEIVRALSDEAVCERLRNDAEAATLFRRLVRQPRRVKFKRDSTLSEFHDVGILLAMIPEFRPVVGRVHHDIYHVYTVDAHSIAAVDRLRKFRRGELSSTDRLASRLAADMARPQVLYMALLLHDVGKDTGGRAHGERGADLARTILERLGVQEHDIVEIQHLIRKHLRMYHVASRRDIDDPRTIEDFRGEVHGPEGLKELYLLTLCDVATTSPTALTEWKARMLEELYVTTRRSFEGLPGQNEERAEALRRATRTLAVDGGEADFLEHFLKSVPNRYMYANEPSEIIRHARIARESEEHESFVQIVSEREPYAELAFVTEDRPGALAHITASLAANKVRVIGAQLYSWGDRKGRRRVLDVFWVRCGRDVEALKRSLPRLRTDLERLLNKEVKGDDLIQSRKSSRLEERASPDVPVFIDFDNRCSSHYTVIEILSEDQPALLYRLARTLRDAGLSVAVAKINTEGNAVADVFYVCDGDGKKLEDEAQLAELETRLRKAVFKERDSRFPPAETT